MSHQSMVFSGTCHFKNQFSIFCPLFTVSPPSLFSLAPRIHPVPWTDFSKWFPPLFLIGYFRLLILLLFQSFPPFYSAPFPKLCHPAWTISIASIFICHVHLSSTQLEQSHGIFLYEWFMILSFCRNTAVYLLICNIFCRMLEENNKELHENLLQTVACIENMEAELQCTKTELVSFKEKYRRSAFKLHTYYCGKKCF